MLNDTRHMTKASANRHDFAHIQMPYSIQQGGRSDKYPRAKNLLVLVAMLGKNVERGFITLYQTARCRLLSVLSTLS
jgi:hypothetical protein